MSVPTCTGHPRSIAARRNGVNSSFITTSPTNVPEARRDTSSGSGSPGFMPSGVALTTTSQPDGSFDPVRTESRE